MKFFSLLTLSLALLAKDEFFFEKPYLQLGDRPTIAAQGALDLMWLGHDKDVDFVVEYKSSGGWLKATPKMVRRVDFKGTEPHRVYSASLEKLKPGAAFTYRVSVGDQQLIEASSIARKATNANTRFVVWGDCSVNTDDQRAVAYQASLIKPDYIFITGDIVYNRGRVSEYQSNFWPIYNADQASLKTGAPLLRSTPFTGVVGNHDAQGDIDLAVNPDPLAYFHYWSQPLNGPTLSLDHKFVPKFKGDDVVKAKFLEATKLTFPGMANFSFDYGNVHWTVIDSNSYVDWTDAELRKWVADDLKAAAKAKWRIVAYHHPPFNSSKAHGKEQRLRMLADVLEAGKADLILSGHVHNYQRTYPLTFQAEPGFVLGKNQQVPGKWTLDKTFDGVKNTKPKAPIYIVTGAGGARLYNQEQTNDKSSWQEFTTNFVSNIHSFSVIDTTAKTLTFKQISAEGKELDHFTITR
ncbi:MAG: metallophosphoesterase [Acidobacteria bacterium]|nr:metallophosphoesterase [Acidobacteriota bacterium]